MCDVIVYRQSHHSISSPRIYEFETKILISLNSVVWKLNRVITRWIHTRSRISFNSNACYCLYTTRYRYFDYVHTRFQSYSKRSEDNFKSLQNSCDDFNSSLGCIFVCAVHTLKFYSVFGCLDYEFHRLLILSFLFIPEYHRNSSSSAFKNTLFQYLIWLAFVMAFPFLSSSTSFGAIVFVFIASYSKIKCNCKSQMRKNKNKTESKILIYILSI